MNGTIRKSTVELLTQDQKRAEIAFKALSELNEALDPDRPKPAAVLRRIVREAKEQIDKVTNTPFGRLVELELEECSECHMKGDALLGGKLHEHSHFATCSIGAALRGGKTRESA